MLYKVLALASAPWRWGAPLRPMADLEVERLEVLEEDRDQEHTFLLQGDAPTTTTEAGQKDPAIVWHVCLDIFKNTTESQPCDCSTTRCMVPHIKDMTEADELTLLDSIRLWRVLLNHEVIDNDEVTSITGLLVDYNLTAGMWAKQFRTMLHVNQAGDYSFWPVLQSTASAAVFIEGQLVAEATCGQEASGCISLEQGDHVVNVMYGEYGLVGDEISLEYRGPDTQVNGAATRIPIPKDKFKLWTNPDEANASLSCPPTRRNWTAHSSCTG